jgi:hypothetical protein
MNKQTSSGYNWLISIFIIAAAAIRVGINSNGQWHALTSFSPIGAMALFGGAYFTKRTASFIVPLLTLFVSDAILALTVYSKYSNGILYSGWYWVYGATALMVIVGIRLGKKNNAVNLVLSALAITCIHWIVTDLGVWTGSSIYPQNAAGFLACLAAALPFEKNFLLGSLVYGGLMFGAVEWIKMYRPAAIAAK